MVAGSEQRAPIAPDVSLVIPTFNERQNIEPLLREIDAALAGLAWEALFVDDSTDGTDSVIAGLAERDPRVRLRHRPVNRDGLAGAVTEGLALAGAPYIGVLDADLQHPPTAIPALLDCARRRSADVVVASRYRRGGSAAGLDGPLRRLASRASRLLVKTLFREHLRGVSDPLSGFFLVRRSLVQGVALRPIGYKILLEILVRCPWRSVAEVPYTFHRRRRDASKASASEGLRFLRHIIALRCR